MHNESIDNPMWVLYPQVDSFVKQPKENLKLRLSVRNVVDKPLYFTKLEIVPSWIKEKKGIKQLNLKDYIAPGDSTFLTEFDLRLPSKPGFYKLKFGLETWIYNLYTADWKNCGVLWTSEWGPIQITPKPIYTAFVSYSSRKEDIPVVEEIIKLIEMWGFRTVRVGIDVFAEDPWKIPDDIKTHVDKYDAFIAIATPRDYIYQEKRFKTFAWLHIESTMAFDSKKPLLFIVDERIKPEGLLEFPKFPKIFYHPLRLNVLEQRLSIIMPSFRKWVSDKKKEEFMDSLIKAGLVVGGIWLLGKTMEEK